MLESAGEKRALGLREITCAEAIKENYGQISTRLLLEQEK